MKRIVRLTESDLSRIVRRVINESKKSVEFLDLDKLEKNGGVEVYDGDRNKVLDNFEVFGSNALNLNIENRLFDNDEVLEIDIDGLIPEKVELVREDKGSDRNLINKNLEIFNYVDDRYLIKLPLSLLKDGGSTSNKGVPKHILWLDVKGNIDTRGREIFLTVDLSKARIKSKEE